MNERAEAEPAAIVRSGSAGLWLDGAADQSEGSVCLHSSRGANPPREPWPRSKPVAEGRTKPTLALSPALCTPMAYSSGSTAGLAHPFSCNHASLLTSWLTVATTSTLISATLSSATVGMTNMWMSADNCSWNTRICMYVGQSFWVCVFAHCKATHWKWILYVNIATLLCSSCKNQH